MVWRAQLGFCKFGYRIIDSNGLKTNGKQKGMASDWPRGNCRRLDRKLKSEAKNIKVTGRLGIFDIVSNNKWNHMVIWMFNICTLSAVYWKRCVFLNRINMQKDTQQFFSMLAKMLPRLKEFCWKCTVIGQFCTRSNTANKWILQHRESISIFRCSFY